MADKYSITLANLDGGREGLWLPPKWLNTIEILKNHEGESVYREDSAVYDDLTEKIPDESWKNYDANGAFRPLFRDYSHPWTRTGLLSLSEQRFALTRRGKDLIDGMIAPTDVLMHLFEEFEENNCKPFSILAAAFLQKINRPFTLEETVHGVLFNWRPNIDVLETSLSLVNNQSDISDNRKRRFRLALSLMERAGLIFKISSGYIAWDYKKLEKIAEHQRARITPELQSFITDLSRSLPPELQIKGNVLSCFVASLLAKNFLILTGLSGSGKTKLAQAFATWICEEENDIELVPVGADWTSRENVLGYVDTINQAYHKEAALELILRAKANCDDVEQQTRPFFLILDEMNLSHVERYFSDFLSAIESEKAIPMHSNEDADKPGSGIWCGVPQGLKLPKNLFVIGTVNVDETTYMFSPKVLDRANTIEFRVDPEDFDSFMDEAKPIELEKLRKDGKGLGSGYGPALVETAAMKASLKGVDDDAHKKLKREMGVLIRMFGATGWEFGYRTGKEVTRFVYFHKLLAGSGWEFEDALDAQIVQKLMPKLNGSEDKLRGILCALAWFSSGLVKVPEKAKHEDDGPYYQKLAEIFTQLAGKRNPENLAKALSEASNPLSAANAGTEFEEIDVTAFERDLKRAKLPLTFDKTLRMWRAAKQNGFTSYAEN